MGGQEALDAFLRVLANWEHCFKVDDDSSIVYWTSYGFYLNLYLLVLGGDFIASINSVQCIDSGFVADVPGLLLLRAITIEERGDDKDVADFISCRCTENCHRWLGLTVWHPGPFHQAEAQVHLGISGCIENCHRKRLWKS